jgi:hypothetical protein
VVVQCPSDFPDFSSTHKRPPSFSQQREQEWKGRKLQREKDRKLLDFDETVREIHALGSTAFTGKQKRKHLDTQYEELTGRKKKKHSVPLPIVRGIRKKAEQREKRELQELKESGVVTHRSAKKSGNNDTQNARKKNERVHGPAPDNGFLVKGVLRVEK